MTLPAEFVDRVLRDLGGEEGAALCAALDEQPPVSVRLNPAKAVAACDSSRGMAACGDPAVVTADAVYNVVDSGSAPADAGYDVGGLGSAPSDAGSVAVHYGSAPSNAGRDVGGKIAAMSCAADAPDGGKRTLDNPDACSLPALEIAGQVPWCSEGRYLTARPQFTLDPDFHAGAYYVQEASSQFVGHLLGGVRCEGARILDLCAAPGGKTTLYASLAGPEGLVVANEIDRRRASVLADNVRKWGTGNVAVTTCEPRALGDFEAWFDVVAVDAPCSGEGMFRKDPDARAEWSENNVKQCAARQDEILREAWRALKPGGTLIYSTCTFNRDEDEGAMERMLAWAGDEAAESEAVAVEDAWGIVCGRVGVFRTFRFYPHKARGEGFFAAVARKSFDTGGRMRTPKARRTVFTAVDRRTVAELARWVCEPERMCFATVGDTCYAWYDAQADAVRALAEALPVIYSGVALGQVFKGLLKPDPALAFFAELDRAALPVAELGEEEALRYLRKQDIAAEGLAQGVNLVCARGHALGFAKRIGARVNNMYPNSLRIVKQ